MILLRWAREKVEGRLNCWALDIGLGSLGVYEQVEFETGWGSAGRYLNASITGHFHLGEWHGYYDGPHCSFSLGFLHFNWSWGWCDKCYPAEGSPCYDGFCSHSYHQGDDDDE